VENETFLTIIIRRLRTMHTLDRIALLILAVIVVFVAVFATKQIAKTHEISAAQKVSDQVVAALAKQDTKAILALGTTDLQKSITADELSKKLVFTYNDKPMTFADLYGSTTPTIDQTIVANNDNGQHVAFIYKYNSLKTPFYVRLDTINSNGKWLLQALSPNSDEGLLLTGTSSSDASDNTMSI